MFRLHTEDNDYSLSKEEGRIGPNGLNKNKVHRSLTENDKIGNIDQCMYYQNMNGSWTKEDFVLRGIAQTNRSMDCILDKNRATSNNYDAMKL